MYSKCAVTVLGTVKDFVVSFLYRVGVVELHLQAKLLHRIHYISSIVRLRVQFGANGIWLITSPTYDFRNSLN